MYFLSKFQGFELQVLKNLSFPMVVKNSSFSFVLITVFGKRSISLEESMSSLFIKIHFNFFTISQLG